MIKIRLIRLLKGSGKYIFYQVIWQWLSLLAQILIAWQITHLILIAWQKQLTSNDIIKTLAVVSLGIIGRYICDFWYIHAGFCAGADVKRILRDHIYQKLLHMGPSYRKQMRTSEIVQMTGEGVEQLEIYFSRYLSQFFYALLAPITLFIIIYQFHAKTACLLLISVFLIPIVIMLVMLVAKKVLSRYFAIYYRLGDHFLEKLRGMTCLKIYQADQRAAKEMDEEAEQFRKITMKVLMMQLNSTTIMDIIAYGGAAVGIISVSNALINGEISFLGSLMVIFLAAEFFLPMRLLGSFFHVGMNGVKASDRIFAFLDLPEGKKGTKLITFQNILIQMQDVFFTYDHKRDILKKLSLTIKPKTFISLVGVSGSGKSTIANILMGFNNDYQGSIKINGIEQRTLSFLSIRDHFTLISHHSWLFKGTVRENLLFGNPNANDEMMNNVLKKVNLFNFIYTKKGLNTLIDSDGANLSGGQRQRLALARALLHDTELYIFDEATSNIDAHSEEIIMQVIHELAKQKTVILISHRLANVVASDCIYMLEQGQIMEAGKHQKLMLKQGLYYRLFSEQKKLEEYTSNAKELKV